MKVLTVKKEHLSLGGGISFSYTNYTGQEEYYINEIYRFCFNPVLNYYFFDSIHAGIVPAFCVGIEKNEMSTDKYYSVGPEISVGYTFTINPNLFFDVSPAYGYFANKYYDDNGDDLTYYSNYSLTLSLKFIINNNTLINAYLEESYTDYSDNYAGDGKYKVLLGAGVTSFVNF